MVALPRAFAFRRPDVEGDVGVRHVLVDGVAREPGQCQVLGTKVNVGFLGPGIAQSLVQKRQRRSFPDHRNTPTRTLRKRAGAAPCPVCPNWPGCPFPQLGVPHMFQCFSLQTASHDFQNSGVIPV